jgi:hypothetical protein
MEDHSEYCRQLEAYLCQKNGGHLVRIVGPAFEKVRGWAELGVPLKVAYRGIDRYCERHAQRGRRRPARIEFCEADVLEQFDDWRRAVGVAAAAAGESGGASRKPTLASHVERVVSRLIARRSVGSPAFERQIEMLLRELDRLAGDARRARGESRGAVVERLARLDDELMQVAAAELDDRAAAAARREAAEELAPFGARMGPDARARALEAAFVREVRESLDLPTISY